MRLCVWGCVCIRTYIHTSMYVCVGGGLMPTLSWREKTRKAAACLSSVFHPKGLTKGD